MEIEKQVSSLESSKKMRELGFMQVSTFYWTGDDNLVFADEPKSLKLPFISAFTVAELGEMLPKIKLINGIECSLRIWANDTGEYWYCGYGRNGIMEINGSHGKGKTLAEAMSKMLIYLAEQNLINPKEIKLWK